ncbi:MAG: hypothetical protein KC731_18810 [Myxococcales bacterium]|nr:hypothetical protein [Myxococcales bacterium]
MAVGLKEYLGVPGSRVVVIDRGPAPAPHWPDFVAAADGWLEVEVEAGPAPRVTTLRGSRPHGAITLVGDVEARQLAPLAEILRSLATGRIDADTPATQGLLAELEAPVTMETYVGATCPFCPAVAAASLRFALSSPLVAVTIRRADQVEAPADVTSVPTVRVNGVVVSRGSIGEYALAEAVVGAAKR